MTTDDDSLPRRPALSTMEDPASRAFDLLAGGGMLTPDDATERDRALAIVQRSLVGLGAEPPRIGRFLVLQRIGAGGMGVVYAAYDQELDRKVAIKMIRDGDRVPEERVRREAKIMAKLSHPNIVQVYEVGTHDDRLFIAMEYVRGTTLAQWCREHARGWADVLRVYRQAGEGLAAAHAAGLVHRDFKPDNALVGDDERVRVVDFGLARRGGPASAEPADANACDVRLTSTGAILGTPAYMAAEQFVGGDVDARTDQFSFCVALWEALYGERPFGDDANVRSISTAVIEGRLRTPANAGKIPRSIHDALAKGLHRDQSGRHASMAELLAALGRDPFRKRRVVIAIGVLGLGAAATVGARAWTEQRDRLAIEHATQLCETAGASIDEVWNDGERAAVRDALLTTGLVYAPSTADKVTQWLDAHAAAWTQARTDACLDAEVRGSWTADQLDRSVWCLDESKSELQALVAALAHADARGAQRAVQAAAGLAGVAVCRDADVLARRPTPPTERRDELAAIRSELSHASALRNSGSFDEGLTVARAALERAEAAAWPPLIAAARVRTGILLEAKGEFAEAEAMHESAYFAAAKAGADEVALEAADQLAFTVGLRLARPADGLRWARLAELMLMSVPDPTGTKTADHLDKTALVHASAGEHDEARALLEQALALQEQALGSDHPELVLELNNLATVTMEGGAADAARADLERALGIAEHAFGPDHPVVGTLAHNLGNASLVLGDHVQAQRFYERALGIRERALGPAHPDVGGTLNNLGELCSARGDFPRAREYYARALAIAEQALGPEHPEVAGSLGNLGNVAQATGAYEDARDAHERALRITEAAFGPDHPRVAVSLNNLANALASLREFERARPLLERALEIREAALGPAHPDVLQTLHNLATLHREAGDPERARSYDERARALERLPRSGP